MVRPGALWGAVLLAACADSADTGETAAPPVGPTCAEGSTFLTWSTDAGVTLAPVSHGPNVNTYTWGIAIDPEDPSRIWAEHGGTLWLSVDAGCSWSGLATLPTTGWALEASSEGVVWGYSVNQGYIARIDRTGVTTTNVGDSLLGMGVDLADPDHVRVGGDEAIHETTDGGESWGATYGPGSSAYSWAFDPRDVQNVILGSVAEGAWTSTDGGQNWTPSSGLGSRTNLYSVRWSLADAAVVWAEGVDLDEADGGAASGGRHVWRSEDGGRTFVSVLEQGPDVALTNGVPLATDPFDASTLHFVSTSPAGGAAVYRYDHAAATTTSAPLAWDGASALAFSPVTPGLLYLALVDEEIDGTER